MMRKIPILTVLLLALCQGCNSKQKNDAAQATSPERIPKQQELLWRLSENGTFEPEIEKYDPVKRIVQVSMPQAILPGGRKSVLAHEFANGAALPYQFDGTNWIPLWSPSLPPEIEAELRKETQSTQQRAASD